MNTNCTKKSKPITMFVGGLNPETTEQSIFLKLSTIDTVKNIRLVLNHKTGLSKCFAFFDISSPEAMHKFLNPGQELFLDGRPLFFQKANQSEKEKEENIQKRIYLKNLPIRNPITNLKEIFEIFGQIRSAYQIKDKNKVFQDYGFVDFVNVEDARKLLEVKKLNIEGRIVSFAPYKKLKSGNRNLKHNTSTKSKKTFQANNQFNHQEYDHSYNFNNYYIDHQSDHIKRKESKEQLHMRIKDRNYQQNISQRHSLYRQSKPRNSSIELNYNNEPAALSGNVLDRNIIMRQLESVLRNGQRKYDKGKNSINYNNHQEFSFLLQNHGEDLSNELSNSQKPYDNLSMGSPLLRDQLGIPNFHKVKAFINSQSHSGNQTLMGGNSLFTSPSPLVDAKQNSIKTPVRHLIYSLYSRYNKKEKVLLVSKKINQNPSNYALNKPKAPLVRSYAHIPSPYQTFSSQVGFENSAYCQTSLHSSYY